MFDIHRDDPKVYRFSRGSIGTSLAMKITLPSILSLIVLLLILSHCRDFQHRAKQGALRVPG